MGPGPKLSPDPDLYLAIFFSKLENLPIVFGIQQYWNTTIITVQYIFVVKTLSPEPRFQDKFGSRFGSGLALDRGFL
jgi:hypothetical protein